MRPCWSCTIALTSDLLEVAIWWFGLNMNWVGSYQVASHSSRVRIWSFFGISITCYEIEKVDRVNNFRSGRVGFG